MEIKVEVFVLLSRGAFCKKWQKVLYPCKQFFIKTI